jgi:hypothetical protein
LNFTPGLVAAGYRRIDVVAGRGQIGDQDVCIKSAPPHQRTAGITMAATQP